MVGQVAQVPPTQPWRFPKMGVPLNSWMVYRTENPKLKWMMTGELVVPPKILASDC